MDSQDFRKFGYAAIDFVADYLDNVRERQVLPSVEPGYLYNLLPANAPKQPESWQDIMKDINDTIMQGITHWQSPNFHGFYPTQTSFGCIVGDMIANGLGTMCFSWICNPACTELEVIVLDWLAKLFELPKEFLYSSDGNGGGVMQTSASEAILVAMLTSREQNVKRLRDSHSHLSESDIRGKLVIYSSDQSNSSIEKSALIAAVRLRLLSADKNGSLRGEVLKKAIEEDIKNGYIPIVCIATFGTTGTCAFDAVNEIGPICREYKIWLHIDAAYAGSALCCPEFRSLMTGIEFADSLNINLYKWLMVNFDGCAMWLRDASKVVDALTVDRIYLKDQFQGEKAPEYRHWQLGLGRRFSSLKVWVMLRTVGTENIKKNIRNHVRLVNIFEAKVRQDDRFEIAAKPALGLVCFRLKAGCQLTGNLLDKIIERKNIYMIRAKCDGQIVIRFSVCGFGPEEQDIDFAWNEILSQAVEVLRN